MYIIILVCREFENSSTAVKTDFLGNGVVLLSVKPVLLLFFAAHVDMIINNKGRISYDGQN